MKPACKPASLVAFAFSISLAAMSLATANEQIYIPMGGNDNILIVETKTGEIVDKIEGVPAVHGLGATPDGNFLIAGSFITKGMGVEVEEQAKPEGMSDADHKAHHSSGNSMENSGTQALVDSDSIATVSVINTRDNEIVRLIDVPAPMHHVSVSPDGKYAAVTHTGEGTVSVIDLETYELAATFATGSMPNYSVFDSNSRLYVSNAGNNTVSVVNVANFVVERNIVVGETPEHMALSQNGAALYIGNVSEGTVSVLDTAKLEVIKTINIGGNELHGVELSDDGATLFVANRAQNKLASFNLETGELNVVDFIPGPYHLTMVRGSDEIYLSSDEGEKVWVVNANTLETVREIAVGGRAHQMVQITQ